jgi:site-specific DNA-cytosine methylase
MTFTTFGKLMENNTPIARALHRKLAQETIAHLIPIKTMQAISLFTGIGGFEIAFNQVFGEEGKVIQMVEIDPDAQQVLSSHFPNTPIHSDICTYHPNVNWNYTTGIIFGGFPCTNTSCAGDRTGLPLMLQILNLKKIQVKI